MSLPHQIESLLSQGQGPQAGALLQGAAENLSDDELHQIGEGAARQYREFQSHAVHQFLSIAEEKLPGAAYQRLLEPVAGDMKATRQWDRRLDEMASERLINGLMERIKARDDAGAEATALALIMSVPEESRPQRARFVGNMLGGMVNDKDHAQGLVRSMSRNPMKFGLDPLTVTDVEEEFAQGAAAAQRRERDIGSAARQNLTEAAVELSRQLPGRNALNQPSDEEIAKFDQAVRAIIRACLLSPAYDKFNEATRLLVEFSPKQMSGTATMAGIEQRLHTTLGRTARMIADRVFQAVGQSRRVIEPYVDFSKRHLYDRVGHYCIEVLGLFRNSDTIPFVRQTLSDKKAEVRTEAIFALGSMGNDEAFEVLLETMKQDLGGRVIEGEQRREVATIISALGRMVRATPDPQRRSALIKRTIAVFPKDDLEFPVRAVLNFFTGKQEGIDPDLLRWAAQVAVTALWSTDRPELARAAESQPLGFRQPLLDLLGRLAPFAMGTINETALKYSKMYSGAYLAMGELYGKYPDPSQVPVIQQMLFNAALHDDTKRSEYVKDTLTETATGSRQELTKDQVIAALAGALVKIDSDDARQAMSQIFQQIQGGQLPQPGPETAALLLKGHMAAQKAAGRQTMAGGGARKSGAAAGDGTVDGGEAVAPAQVTEVDLKYMEDLKARYFMASKRRAKKVAAMNALAQHKIAAAAPLMVPLVNDGDAIIASAAAMALQDMVQPPVAESSAEAVYKAVLDGVATGGNVLKVKLGEVLQKMRPGRAPLKDLIEGALKRDDMDAAGRAVLERVLNAPGAAGGPVHKREAGPLDEDKLGGAAGYMPKGGGDKGSEYLSDLDKKRAYMQARQEWIRGGKRGPEPVPPE